MQHELSFMLRSFLFFKRNTILIIIITTFWTAVFENFSLGIECDVRHLVPGCCWLSSETPVCPTGMGTANLGAKCQAMREYYNIVQSGHTLECSVHNKLDLQDKSSVKTSDLSHDQKTLDPKKSAFLNELKNAISNNNLKLFRELLNSKDAPHLSREEIGKIFQLVTNSPLHPDYSKVVLSKYEKAFPGCINSFIDPNTMILTPKGVQKLMTSSTKDAPPAMTILSKLDEFNPIAEGKTPKIPLEVSTHLHKSLKTFSTDPTKKRLLYLIGAITRNIVNSAAPITLF